MKGSVLKDAWQKSKGAVAQHEPVTGQYIVSETAAKGSLQPTERGWGGAAVGTSPVPVVNSLGQAEKLLGIYF